MLRSNSQRSAGVFRVSPFYIRWLCVLVVLTCSACHSPPIKPSSSLALQQTQVLRALGFAPIDDGWLLTLPDSISFKTGESAVSPAAERQLVAAAAEMWRVQIRRLRLEGHTDNVGSDAINVDLSVHRAEATAHIFIKQGFADASVIRRGLGASVPLTSNDTEEGRARNRRVEIIVPADALDTAP